MSEIISPKTLGLKYSGGGNVEWIEIGINSLHGSPEQVNGDFIISTNNLISLKFSPTIIKGDYVCGYNLIDFSDIPVLDISGDFYFSFERKSVNEIKNISKILLKLKSDNLQRIHNSEEQDFKNEDNSSTWVEMINDLFERKKAGEDIEQLYVEGMNWCCDQGFPASFWGEMDC